MMIQAYLTGWKQRRADIGPKSPPSQSRKRGARDALTGAFEELKKFEHVAETTRLNKLMAAAKRGPPPILDEMGLRRRG